jgi:hypothetical protein
LPSVPPEQANIPSLTKFFNPNLERELYLPTGAISITLNTPINFDSTYQVNHFKTKEFSRLTNILRISSPIRIASANGTLSDKCHSSSGAVPKKVLNAGT